MARHGSQVPTFHVSDDYDHSEGQLAVALGRAYGNDPLPWQSDILDDWLAVDEDGRLVHDTCILDTQRQNGKTDVVVMREDEGLVVRGERILHTSHEYQSTRTAFDRLREKFGNKPNDPYARFPELNALVKRYTQSAGHMKLELTNGGMIEFRTRGSGQGTGRGGTFDVLVIDEAQEYTDEQDAALSPVNSAAPSGSPQTIFLGTVPDPSSSHGKVFARIRDTALGAKHDGICMSEWSVSEIGDVLDVDRWYATNPSLGYFLLESALRKDARGMAPDTFAREHLGWWHVIQKEDGPAVIKPEQWERVGTTELPDGRMALGVHFSPDGSRLDVAVAASDGERTVVQLAVSADTMEYGLKRLTGMVRKRLPKTCLVAIDGRSYAGAFAQMLKEEGAAKDVVKVMTTTDAVNACAMLASAIADDTLGRVESDVLTESATTSTRRAIGRSGGWGFGGERSGAITAAAQALWALRTSKRDPTRKARVG